MKFAPAVARSSRSFKRFETSDFKRLGSTPVFDWIFLENVDVALELLQHFAARIAPRRDGEDLEQARYGGARAPGRLELGVVAGLRVQKFQAQERPHALVERLLVDDGSQLRLRVGMRFGVGVHGPILSQQKGHGKP